jgi:glycosyltransferase involved in cell wall biosynthesis
VEHNVPVHPWTQGAGLAKKFAEGFCADAGLAVPNYAWTPCSGSISVVLTAMNEALSLTSVLDQLERFPVNEIIIVVNGSTDGTFEMARARSKAIIVHYTDALGHDVGRAIGAKLARSEIVLFLDGDFPVSAEQLVLFADAIERGTDVAMNNITPFLGQFGHRDSVTMVKELLNRAIGRRDLEANSLTAVPHALSRKAINEIGYHNLLVPPKAQAIAISKGLKLSCPVSVDVISINKVRNSNTGSHNRVADLIIGDHLEALSMLMEEKGDRLEEPDRIRNRSLLAGVRA